MVKPFPQNLHTTLLQSSLWNLFFPPNFLVVRKKRGAGFLNRRPKHETRTHPNRSSPCTTTGCPGISHDIQMCAPFVSFLRLKSVSAVVRSPIRRKSQAWAWVVLACWCRGRSQDAGSRGPAQVLPPRFVQKRDPRYQAHQKQQMKDLEAVQLQGIDFGRLLVSLHAIIVECPFFRVGCAGDLVSVGLAAAAAGQPKTSPLLR